MVITIHRSTAFASLMVSLYTLHVFHDLGPHSSFRRLGHYPTLGTLAIDTLRRTHSIKPLKIIGHLKVSELKQARANLHRLAEHFPDSKR